jgi:hypothetical protein
MTDHPTMPPTHAEIHAISAWLLQRAEATDDDLYWLAAHMIARLELAYLSASSLNSSAGLATKS